MGNVGKQTHDLVQILTGPSNFKDDLIKYSQFLCRPLADLMHSRLPRELREYVYKALVPAEWLGTQTFRIVILPSAVDSIHSGSPFWNEVDELRHFEDQRYVGVEFAKEIAEYRYAQYNFHFPTYSLHRFGEFLHADPYGFGIPCSRLVRHLELSVSLQDTLESEPGHLFEVDMTDVEARRNNLIRHLGLLSEIRRCCKITFLVFVSRGLLGLFSFSEILDILLRFIAGLKEHGSTVDVKAIMPYVGTWMILDSSSTPIGQVLIDIKKVKSSSTL